MWIAQAPQMMQSFRDSVFFELLFQIVAFVIGWLIAYRLRWLSSRSAARATWVGEHVTAPKSKMNARTDVPLNRDKIEELLRECAREGDLATCWRHWRSMQSGSRLSEETCRDLGDALLQVAVPTAVDVDTALEISLASNDEALAHAALEVGGHLRNAAWLLQNRNRLQAAGMRAPRCCLSDLVRAFAREWRSDLIIKTWLEHRSDEEATGSESEWDLYSDVVEGLVSCGNLGVCARFVRSEGWRSPKTPPGRAAFQKLICWMAKCHCMKSALECLARLRSAGGEAHRSLYRALIKESVRAGAMAQAEDLYASMLRSGLKPDFQTFSRLVRGYCVARDLDRALKHFNLGRQHHIFPDLKLCVSLLELCVSTNSLESAERLLEDMQAAGIRPSARAWSTLARLHIARGDLDMALELFEDLPCLRREGLDVRTYHALVTASMAADSLEGLESTLARLGLGRSCVGSRTCELLIMAYVRRGHLTRAVKLIEAAVRKPKPGGEAAGGERRHDDPASRGRSFHLLPDPRILEELLQLIGQRGQARDLGWPLIKMLVEHSCGISAFTVQRMCTAAATEETTGVSAAVSMHAERRRQRLLWCQSVAAP